jgi:hypothetical protein
MNIHIKSTLSDDERRRELYRGSLFVHAATPSSLKLCRLAQQIIRETFGDADPQRVHETMPAEQCATLLADMKPRFIHHPEAKHCLSEMLAECDCDLNKTYFDVPRLRTAFPGDYLSTGIAYAFHPHRDTRSSAPFCQINWWMPVYPVTSDNCMAIHPHYWDHAVKNGSQHYNYFKWNQESRHTAAQHVKQDTRVQPKPEEPMQLEPQIRLVCEVGGAYQFSGAQMHSTVPNTSGLIRYSIDFRTVHLDDVVNRIDAANIDSACTGTTMGDYLRGNDYSHLPTEALALYLDGTEKQYGYAIQAEAGM